MVEFSNRRRRGYALRLRRRGLLWGDTTENFQKTNAIKRSDLMLLPFPMPTSFKAHRVPSPSKHPYAWYATDQEHLSSIQCHGCAWMEKLHRCQALVMMCLAKRIPRHGSARHETKSIPSEMPIWILASEVGLLFRRHIV